MELTLFRRRGTGIPKEENRQVHAILSHSMNIALRSLFFLKITSFLHQDVQRTLCLYVNSNQTVIILTYNCKGKDVFRMNECPHDGNIHRIAILLKRTEDNMRKAPLYTIIRDGLALYPGGITDCDTPILFCIVFF